MDLSSTASPSSTQTPPNGAIKKAIFKKPSWLANRQPSASLAKNETNSDNTKTSDAVDIFSRSNDTHAAILAEREQKERKAREKKESKTVKREKSGIREVRFSKLDSETVRLKGN